MTQVQARSRSQIGIRIEGEMERYLSDLRRELIGPVGREPNDSDIMRAALKFFWEQTGTRKKSRKNRNSEGDFV